MTVRITKPEFNLRDKLTELEFLQLPYHKIPNGSVCQRRFYYLPNSGGAENETTSTSFQDASYYIHSFTPRFIDSVIMVEFTTQIKRTRNDGRYNYHRIQRVNPDGTTVNLDYDGNGLSFDGQIVSGGSGDITYAHLFLREIDTPYTTDQITYKLQHKVNNSDTTIRLGENGQNRRLNCTIIEIKGLAGLERGRI